MGGAASVATEGTLTEANKAALFTHLKAAYDESLTQAGSRERVPTEDLLARLQLEYESKAREMAAANGGGRNAAAVAAAAAAGGTAANSEPDEPADGGGDLANGPTDAVILEGAVSEDEAAATALAFASKLGNLGASGGNGAAAEPVIGAAAAAAAAAAGKSPSDFRKRRLSVTAKKAVAHAAGEESRRASKVMYRAQEIGAASAVPLPLDDMVVGTYSCHGVEPSFYEEDGVVAKINQDRGCVVFPFAEDSSQVLFAVFDGHGEHGDVVSHFVMHELQQALEQHPTLVGDPVRALTETFLSVDKALGGARASESTFSGTTAVAALMRGTKLWVANAGDSRAVLAVRRPDGSLEASDLSQDQNPDSPAEQARILKSGGFVSPPPEPGLSARVWLDPEMTQIGLAMARSIGDHAVKPIGVIAEPVVTTRTLTPADEFMVIASDGVWEFLSSQDAINILAPRLRAGATAMQATQALIEAAAQRWREVEGDYRDDITALLVRLPCVEG